jgi:hypothetical protein
MLNPVTKAMRETEEAIATARIDTRKRKLWSYVVPPPEELEKPGEYALTFFQKPADTPVRIARGPQRTCLVAVWDGQPDDPLTEPHDWPPHGMRDERDGPAPEAGDEKRHAVHWLLAIAIAAVGFIVYELVLR